MPTIDLPADLNAEDDEDRWWGLLRDAHELAAVVAGAVVIGGAARFWSVVRVEHVDDDGQVHFVAVPPDEPDASASSPYRPDPPAAMYQRCTTTSVNSGEHGGAADT